MQVFQIDLSLQSNPIFMIGADPRFVLGSISVARGNNNQRREDNTENTGSC